MNEPLVSILIPCYNAEPWIRQCIESALNQTYPNKEIVVVDDGSTDGSADIIRAFDGRITLECNPHAGGNATRNRLTQLARGEWISYLDADDYLLPDKVERQVEFISQCGENVDVLYSPVQFRHMDQPEADYVVDIEDDDAAANFIRWIPFHTNSMLLRRQSVLGAGAWNENQPCCQEHELLLRLFIAGARFKLFKGVGAVYRYHSTNTVSRRDPDFVKTVRMGILERFEDYLRSANLLSVGHKRALYAERLGYARYLYTQKNDHARGVAAERKATAQGRWLVAPTPLLPWRYQIIFMLVGFERAELIAARLRKASPES